MTPTTEAVATATPPAHRHRWFALVIVLTAFFLDLVDVTIVNVAVPSIRRDLHASYSAVQWVTAGYALTFAVGLITGGRLGDIYGRRRIFLIGIAGFTVASALSSLAPGPGSLIAARVLQGAAAALMVPQVLAIIHATFPAEERGKVFGLFGTVAGLGAISGPLIGALLTQGNLFDLQWRPIFLVNLPIGLLGLVLGRRFIAESRAPRALRPDLVGMVLGGAAVLMLLYPLTQGRELGWPWWGFAAMAGSLPVGALFVWHQRARTRRNGSPLVELSLFAVRSFAGGTGVQLTFGIATGIFFLTSTLYTQIGLGWSPLDAGLAGVPFALAVSVAAGLSVAVLVPRFGRRVIQAGALVMAAGALLYLWQADRHGTDLHFWHLVPPTVVMGLGMGLVVAPLADTVLSEVPRAHAGSASGLINATGQVGMALGLGLVSVAFFGVAHEGDHGPVLVAAFVRSLWWVTAFLLVAWALMFALPKRAPAAAADDD
ncbi:MFS transporter [Longispora sp. K20-0274]|uniref:MFS transporter n=1 Tax=Longispora sp. K20-0274 TaxID=3088255 RepID=UPI003999FE46